MGRGFDSEKYIAVQGSEILKRVRGFDRLYLEVGGKLCYDEHAARVLPGYRKTSKIEIIKGLGKVDIVYCISARDLISGREVGLSGLRFEDKIWKDLEDLKKFGFGKIRIVIGIFDGERIARRFGAKLRRRKYRVYFHGTVEGYGKDLDATLRLYGENTYVKCKNDLVVVTGPGGGSGKMGFCMSQIYQERKNKSFRGRRVAIGGLREMSGFAKFESFPIWNLPMTHPVNLAYEAATADLGDYNVVDKFHLKAYGKRAVNYNRDVENFGILMGIARRVSGARNSVPSKLGTGVPSSSGKRWPCGYRSPTDMGVNMMRVGIIDDLVCRRAAGIEIRRRFRRSKGLERERLVRIVGKLGKVLKEN